MAEQTIVALYDDVTTARRVLDDLAAAGLARNDFSLVGGTTIDADYEATRLSSFGSDFSTPANRVSALTGLGVPEEDAQIYAEGVRRGGALLVGVVNDEECQSALDIIERHGPTDIDERSRLYREGGWGGSYDATTEDYDDARMTEERSRYESTGLSAAAAGMRDVEEGRADMADRTESEATRDARTDMASEREEHIPIVEERLEVGKREVERGGIRVRSYAVETPAEASVTLRDETISVERRAVTPDRQAGDEDFTERTIEVTETDEVPVVSKTSHVTEEVVIRKDVEEQAETVRDTVRHTEVDIEDDRTDRTEDTPKRSDT